MYANIEKLIAIIPVPGLSCSPVSLLGRSPQHFKLESKRTIHYTLAITTQTDNTALLAVTISDTLTTSQCYLTDCGFKHVSGNAM